MKILEINKFCFSKGGADKHFLDVVKLLKSNNHKVAVFSMEHPKNVKSKWEKYFVSTVGYTNNYSLWQKLKGAARMFYSLEAKKKINKLLDEFRPDIVHIHNIYHQLSPAILFEIKKRNIPIVMTVHDFKNICPNHSLYHNGEIYERCRNKKYYQCFLDKCVKNSYAKSFLAMLEMYWHNSLLKTYEKNIDLYIAPSQFVKNILEEWGIAAEKIKIFPHFITSNDNTVFQYTVEEKSENKQKNGREECKKECEKYSENCAFYFGRISGKKGADKIIDIFEKIEGLKLYLAGEVEDDFKINKINRSKNSKYLGFLNQAELQNCLNKTSFVISGSKLPETFGLIALETISYGKPFIGFKSGAYGEIVKNGVNGFLAENEKEMKKIIQEIVSGKIIFDSHKIKKSACQKYNQDKYYKNLLDIFKLLC